MCKFFSRLHLAKYGYTCTPRSLDSRTLTAITQWNSRSLLRGLRAAQEWYRERLGGAGSFIVWVTVGARESRELGVHRLECPPGIHRRRKIFYHLFFVALPIMVPVHRKLICAKDELERKRDTLEKTAFSSMTRCSVARIPASLWVGATLTWLFCQQSTRPNFWHPI